MLAVQRESRFALALCLIGRSGAVRTLSEAAGDHAGRADDFRWRAAAAGHRPGLPVLEGPAGSRRRPTNTFPQLCVRVCMSVCVFGLPVLSKVCNVFIFL